MSILHNFHQFTQFITVIIHKVTNTCSLPSFNQMNFQIIVNIFVYSLETVEWWAAKYIRKYTCFYRPIT